MNSTDLLKHFTLQQNQLKSDIREMIQDSNIAIHAKIIDEVENLEGKIDQVIEHQVTQNSRLLKHDKSVVDLEKQVAIMELHPSGCVANKTAKNWKWVLFLSTILIISVNYITQNFTIMQVVDFVKKLI